MNLTEKQKNCPYCHPTKWADGITNSNLGKVWQTRFQDAGGPAWIDLEFNFLVADAATEMNAYATITRIKYCPMCGRWLNELA